MNKGLLIVPLVLFIFLSGCTVTTPAFCGDAVCSESENQNTCARDCGNPTEQEFSCDDFYAPSGSPNINIILGSEAATSTGIWAGNVGAKLAEHAGTIENITVVPQGTDDCIATPSAFDTLVPVRNPLIYPDNDDPSGNRILVGNHLTNIFLADKEDRLTAPGQIIVEVNGTTGDIIVAGFTETDVISAGVELIYHLDRLPSGSWLTSEDVYNTNGTPKVVIVVGVDAPQSHTIVAGNIAVKLAEKAVTTETVTTERSGERCSVNPSRYLSPASVRNPLIFLDTDVPAGANILIGNHTNNLLLSGVADRLTAPGQMIFEMDGSGDIIVAGFTEVDVGRATQELINTLDRLDCPRPVAAGCTGFERLPITNFLWDSGELELQVVNQTGRTLNNVSIQGSFNDQDPLNSNEYTGSESITVNEAIEVTWAIASEPGTHTVDLEIEYNDGDFTRTATGSCRARIS